MKYSETLKKINKNDEWGTPQYLFDDLNSRFNFTLDVCAGNKEKAKCDKFFSPEDNGLIQDWSNDICWMNPPYSQTYNWMKKAFDESCKGAFVVALTFAKTDTKWFHEFCLQGKIIFLKGRLNFEDFEDRKRHSNARAPFGSMITIFQNQVRSANNLSIRLQNWADGIGEDKLSKRHGEKCPWINITVIIRHEQRIF